MSTREEARQNGVEQRYQQQHRQQLMLERSEAEVAETNDVEIQEEARELLAKQRQKAERRTLSMKYRSEAELEISDEMSHSAQQ